jgi:hypothetical protein
MFHNVNIFKYLNITIVLRRLIFWCFHSLYFRFPGNSTLAPKNVAVFAILPTSADVWSSCTACDPTMRMC